MSRLPVTAAILALSLCGLTACHRTKDAAAPATEATPPPNAEPVAPPADAPPAKTSP